MPYYIIHLNKTFMQTPIVMTKLCKLSSFLHHASKEFDYVALYIKEKKIRMTVRSVALKVEQYKQELNSQIGMLRVKCSIKRNNNRETGKKLMGNRNISDKK